VSSVSLMPCPFCGGPATRDGTGSYDMGDESQFISCDNADCRVMPIVMQHQSEYGEWDLADAWNTRAPAG
jgi:hypothetical protein